MHTVGYHYIAIGFKGFSGIQESALLSAGCALEATEAVLSANKSYSFILYYQPHFV